MKTTIRRGCFETNSSSTHSVTILSPAQYAELESGMLLVFDKIDDHEDIEIGKAYSKDELLELGMSSDEIADETGWSILAPEPDEDLDREVSNARTPGGEDVVVVCDYGWR